MSSEIHDSVNDRLFQEEPWEESWEREVVPQLPEALEEQAWRLGAMQRKSGKINRASDLLRGLLAYVLCASSFRGLGAWGVLKGIGDLADTSWRERLRKASAWLAWILSQQLQPAGLQPCPSLKKAGYGAIELVDATHFKCLGPHGMVWRIHCVYHLLTLQLSQVVVSSAKVAENLKQFVLQAGSTYVHDSGYGYRDRIAQSMEAGAYSVTAFYPGSFPMEDQEGKSIEIVKWLKAQRARPGKICTRVAFFWHQQKQYEVRVMALRRSAEQTEQRRRSKKRKAKKDQKRLQAETLYLAGWVLILTTLPASDWSEQEVLSLYRARWHIELLFKRIKQLLSQHRLRAETEETARASVYALLVSWVLQQQVACEMRAILTQVYAQVGEEIGREMTSERLHEEQAALSEWQLQALSVHLFRQQVQGTWSRERLLQCLPLLRRHLKERPRKRCQRWQHAYHWLVDPEPKESFEERDVGRNVVSARRATLA
ncbi:MAG TPA: transposase [Ktedonobacteraceae bacterium]|nr:transposase [Ktedonobacteraceae bacterium]